MKIKSLYISAFGGIKNLKLDFVDGFNVIYGDNENGKSTIMAFIKMMFYGSERGSAQISKNIRKKYTPWDNSAMAGSIDFEHKGKLYRLEKEFRSSNSTDKATLCDLDFGTRQAVSGDIGNKFFGLSLAAFERSVFIGQFGYPENDSVAEGEINSKLSNIVLTGDESVSFEAVSSRIEKAKLGLMSKSGRAGEYDKNLKRYNELKEKIEASKERISDYDRRTKEIGLAQEKVALMQQKAESLKSQISAEQDIKNAQKFKEYLSLKERLDTLKEDLKLNDGTVADEIYLGKLKFCASKAQSVEGKLEGKKQEIKTLQKSLEVSLNPPKDATKENAELLESEISELENKKEKINSKINTLSVKTKETKPQKTPILKITFLLMIILLSVLTGALAFIMNTILLPTVTAAIDAVLIACFVAITVQNRKNIKKKELAQELIKDKIENLKLELSKTTDLIFAKKVSLEAINTALNANVAVIEGQKEMLEETEKQLELLKQEQKETLAPLLELFSRYKPAESLQEVLSCLEEITENVAKQKEVKNQLNFIAKDIGSISYEEARLKLEEVSGKEFSDSADFESLKADYDKLIQSISEHKSAIAAAKVSAESIRSSLGELESNKKELDDVRQKLINQKEFCDAADIAIETLKESFAEVRRSYSSVLEKKAGEIFALLTDDKYSSMGISKSFDINVSEKDVFGSRDIGYLSSGTADQAYLSLRLALVELMCDEKDKLPLMLDDTLAQYDDGRMSLAIKYLSDVSNKSQIIMFTCHKVVRDSATNLGAELITLQK